MLNLKKLGIWMIGFMLLWTGCDSVGNDPSTTLSEDEEAGLIFMREEEKLAHDVYTMLYETWNMNIFSNIASSEATHTSKIAELLVTYNLEDPYQEGIGNFTNPALKALYTQLTETGSNSLEDALKVGALIEDLDIVDLEKELAKTNTAAIITVYEQLQKGSRNHIRSFTDVLSQNGWTYTPQYLTVEEYEAIINSPKETGNGSGNGNGHN